MKEVTLLGRGPTWKACPFNGETWATATTLVTEGMRNFPYDKVFAFDSERLLPEIAEAVVIAKERNILMVSTLPYATESNALHQILSPAAFMKA